MADAALVPHLYLDAVITRNRSLPPRGLFVLIAVFVTMNLLMGVVFVIIGAPVVPVFLGLDVAGLCLAFHISNRDARRRERVQVSADNVRVWWEDGGRSQILWSSPTAFTRVMLEEVSEEVAHVLLAMSGRRLKVGERLSPAERPALFQAIDNAIRQARNERW